MTVSNINNKPAETVLQEAVQSPKTDSGSPVEDDSSATSGDGFTLAPLTLQSVIKNAAPQARAVNEATDNFITIGSMLAGSSQPESVLQAAAAPTIEAPQPKPELRQTVSDKNFSGSIGENNFMYTMSAGDNVYSIANKIAQEFGITSEEAFAHISATNDGFPADPYAEFYKKDVKVGHQINLTDAVNRILAGSTGEGDVSPQIVNQSSEDGLTPSNESVEGEAPTAPALSRRDARRAERTERKSKSDEAETANSLEQDYALGEGTIAVIDPGSRSVEIRNVKSVPYVFAFTKEQLESHNAALGSMDQTAYDELINKFNSYVDRNPALYSQARFQARTPDLAFDALIDRPEATDASAHEIAAKGHDGASSTENTTENIASSDRVRMERLLDEFDRILNNGSGEDAVVDAEES